MIFRSAALVWIAAILVSVSAKEDTKTSTCPPTYPMNTTCGFMHQSCKYTNATGAPACQIGTIWQCRCADKGVNFTCSCRGDGKDAGDTDVEALDVGMAAESGAAWTTAVAALAAAGALAAFV